MFVLLNGTAFKKTDIEISNNFFGFYDMNIISIKMKRERLMNKTKIFKTNKTVLFSLTGREALSESFFPVRFSTKTSFAVEFLLTMCRVA